MTDETGGKPLFCEAVHPSQAAMDRMQEAGWILLCERGELATDPETPSVTIPTAALTELIAAAEECAARLAIYVNTAPVETDRRLREIERRHGEDNMLHVRRLRAAVARVRGE